MRSRARAAAIVALFTASLGTAVTADGSAARAQPADDVQQLADRYAPIVMVRKQDAPCDEDGEPFVPMAVDRILDNRQIALRQLGNGDPTVQRGPSAADLANLGAGFYLDFPGDALDPGCLYEQDNDRFNAGRLAVVYAHVVQEPGRSDQLALQYWLYWYYNDWNNKHESDWEFVQLLFPAAGVAEALGTEPASVGYAQHEGGERADWHDDKLRREGTHPVVYSSQRSHASYFSPALYMGRGASEGFGCDDTEEPSTRVAPEVVVLPEAVTAPIGPLAWIGFEGRWGERHSGPNNGPTGPNTKAQWTAPVTWQEGLRDQSFVVPGGDSGAAQVVDAFCAVVAWGSVQYVAFVASPARVLFGLAVLAALVAFLVRRTSWRAVPAMPLRGRRRAGEIWRLAGAEYRRRPGVFVAAGAIAAPIAALAALLGVVLTHLPFIGRFLDVADPDASSTRLVTSSIVGAAVVTLPFVVISGLVAAVLDDTAVPGRSLGAAWSLLRARAGRLLTALLVVVVVVVVAVLLGLTVAGAPVAVWLFVRWQFMPQTAILEDCAWRDALGRSGQLTRRRWWHTALVTAVTLVLVNALGIAVGLVLLVLFTGLPLWALSAVVAACNILVMPYGALVMTYLYGDAASVARRSAESRADAVLA